MPSAKKQPTAPERTFLFHGEDSYLTQQKVLAWIEAFRSKYGTGGIVKIEFGGVMQDPLLQFRSALESGGLFATKRLVIVRDLGLQKAEAQEEFLELAGEGGSDAFIVFWESAAVKKNLKFYKKIVGWQKANKARIEEFLTPVGSGLHTFIRENGRKIGLQFSSGAVEALASRMAPASEAQGAWGGGKPAYSASQIVAELEKLRSYSNSASVTSSDIEVLVGKHSDDNIFTLVAAIGEHDLKKSLHHLDEIFAGVAPSLQEQKSTALGIVGALALQFSSLLIVVSAKDEGRPTSTVAELLGWSPWRLKNLSRLMAYYPPEALKQALKRLLLIDSQMKSTTLPPLMLLTKFVEETAVGK